MENVVGSSGAVGFQVFPVQVMVVNKRAIEDDPSMWLQCVRNYICRFRGSTPIHRRSQLSLGVRLHDNAAEIRNLPVDLVELLFPPCNNLWIERIEGVQSTRVLWHAEVHRYPQLHAVRSKHISNACELWNEIRVENVEVGVHVTDVASVDTDRRQQSRVLSRTGQVRPHAAVVEEDRTSRVAPLDRAIEVVPLVDPAYRCRRPLHFVESSSAFSLRDLSQQYKRAV